MIAIVGGGISGLALGHALESSGTPHIVLEATGRTGGVIGTRRIDAHRLELGPQRLRATPELDPFLDTLGGSRHDPSTLPLLVVRGGRLHPLPSTLGQALRTSAVSIPGKLRAALEPLASLAPVSPSATAGALLRRRLGDEVYRTFAGPIFGGIYGSDPDRMEASRTLIPAMQAFGGGSFLAQWMARRGSRRRASLQTLPVCVPGEGMEALPRLLHARQGAAVRTDWPVTTIERAKPGGELRVKGPGGELAAERVVVTTPPGAAASMLARIAPELSGALGRLTMNRIVLVHLAVPDLPRGLGFQVAFGEPFRIRGATFSGNLDGSRRTAVVFLGGMADAGAEALHDGELGATASREFEAITGIPAHPIHVHRTAMPAWDLSWRALDRLSPPPGIHLLSNWTGRPGIVGRLREAAALAPVLRGEEGARPGAGEDQPTATQPRPSAPSTARRSSSSATP